MARCSVCGKRVPPMAARRQRRMTGGPVMCRACRMKRIREEGVPAMVCKDCGKSIEPQIIGRILRARKRGRKAPKLCKSCFMKRRPREGVPRRLHTEESLKVDEWDCSNCGANLEPDEVNEIKEGTTVECVYCGNALTIDLFR
jgi:DNA-directed RNA polymerase subunit RPC12/RpoP